MIHRLIKTNNHWPSLNLQYRFTAERGETDDVIRTAIMELLVSLRIYYWKVYCDIVTFYGCYANRTYLLLVSLALFFYENQYTANLLKYDHVSQQKTYNAV